MDHHVIQIIIDRVLPAPGPNLLPHIPGFPHIRSHRPLRDPPSDFPRLIRRLIHRDQPRHRDVPPKVGEPGRRQTGPIMKPFPDQIGPRRMRVHQDRKPLPCRPVDGGGGRRGHPHRRVRRLDGFRQHLHPLVVEERSVVRNPLVGPRLQHDLDGLVEPPRAFLPRDAKGGEFATLEPPPRSPVDPPAGQHIQQRHLLRQPQRVIERRQRHGGADPQPRRPRRRHRPHHVHRRADREPRKMVLRQPNRIVAGAVHDSEPLQRRLVDGCQRHRPVPPAKELQDADFHGVSPAMRPTMVRPLGAEVQRRGQPAVASRGR